MYAMSLVRTTTLDRPYVAITDRGVALHRASRGIILPAGTFPRPVKTVSPAVGWRYNAVESWFEHYTSAPEIEVSTEAQACWDRVVR